MIIELQQKGKTLKRWKRKDVRTDCTFLGEVAGKEHMNIILDEIENELCKERKDLYELLQLMEAELCLIYQSALNNIRVAPWELSQFEREIFLARQKPKIEAPVVYMKNMQRKTKKQ